MQKMVRIGGLAGCASVVIRRGEIIQSGTWGHADIEAKRKFKFDTLCRMYCATKSFVCAAFMTLVDEGRASPDDRLDKYIPAFASVRVRIKGTSKTVKPKQPILLKHLMAHMSGIDYPPDLGDEPEDPDSAAYLKLQKSGGNGSIRSLKSFVNAIAKIPLCDHPGHAYNYSFSFDVLGRVLEVIMGKSLDKCLQERVFDPLGMTDTMWAVPDERLSDLAACYAGETTWRNLYGKGQTPSTPRKGMFRIDGKKSKDSHWRKGKQCSVLSGGGFMGYLYGGLISSVADTTKFVRMLLNHGKLDNGQQFLRKSTVTAMEKNRLPKNADGDRVCYLGNIGCFREGSNEFGMGGAACTYWNIDREDETGVVWFTQHVDMPDAADLKGVNPAKADLWAVLHKAVCKSGGVKRRRSKN